MREKDISLRKKKRERLKINSLKDFKVALKKEGYNIDELDETQLKENIEEIFNVNKEGVERLYSLFNNGKTYRADDVAGLIDYVEKIIIFENEHNKLCEKISKVDNLYIDRVEFEREPSCQDDVEHIIKAIDEIKENISGIISKKEMKKLEELEEDIDREYIYTKDIELLKKMIISKEDSVEERYNTQNQIKTLFVKIPTVINDKYIPAEEGSIEYYQHLCSNIPRIKRLTRNIEKYIEVYHEESKTFRINQSNTLQDSINIAFATYENKEFKAISGSNEIEGYCKAPVLEKGVFISSKVNKLGNLGIGYNRINDSEKKILEEINRFIENKKLRDNGNLTLYSTWEPCPSCYFVIYQFSKKYPNIKIEIKYGRSYGEI